MGLYRGPFLEGFYLSAGEAFERWVEQERARLADAAMTALLELAAAAARDDRPEESAHWWQQLIQLDPLSARLALGYARALVACGDSARAIVAIRAHESLVRQELDIDPDPELKRLEVRIRQQADVPRVAGLARVAGQGEPPGSQLMTAPSRRGAWISRSRVVAMVLGTIVLAALLGWRTYSAPSEPPPSVLDRPFTRSAVASRFYEEGLRAYRAGDAIAARRLSLAALREDSSFAMAAYLASLVSEHPEFEMRQRALRLAANATERERLTIVTDLLSSDMDPSALAVAEDAARRYPDEPGIVRAVGIARFHSGDWAGAVEAFERTIALAGDLDPGDRERCLSCETLGRLSEAYGWWDSLPAVERTARRWLQVYPKDQWPLGLLAMVAARRGDSASALANLRAHVATAPGHRSKDHELAVLLTLELYDQVEQDVRPLLGSAREDVSGPGRWMLFIALRNQGRMRDAELLLRTGRVDSTAPPPTVPRSFDQNDALIALEGGNPRRAAELFDRIRSTSHQPAPGQTARWRAWNSLLMGTALAAAGDTASVRELIDTVQYWGERSLYGRDRKAHHFLRGLLHASAGRDEDAVASYRAAIHSWSFGYTRVNYELAGALLRLGRPGEAILALRPALRGSVDASNLYITRTELHAMLARAFDLAGQPDSASAHYRAVLRAWRRADPQFHPRRSSIETRVARLAQRPHPERGLALVPAGRKVESQ